MRKFKLILALIIIGFIAMFVAQNESYFKTANSFRIKVPMVEEYHSPMVFNWQIGLGAFVLGGVLVFLASLPGRMRTRKTLKELNATIQTHQDQISSLKSESPPSDATFSTNAASTAAPASGSSTQEGARTT